MSSEKVQKEYSQSQKLRFALYDLWSAMGSKMPFEDFYKTEMDSCISQVREKIDELGRSDSL